MNDERSLWDEGESLEDKFSGISLNESKERMILGLIFYSDINKFSDLVDYLPFSRGTVSKYLNELKDFGILHKNVNDDRTVEWKLTDEGILYMMARDWINTQDDTVQELRDKKEKVKKYLQDTDLETSITINDIDDAINEFDFLKKSDMEAFGDPEKKFLKIFTDVDVSKYRYKLEKT